MFSSYSSPQKILIRVRTVNGPVTDRTLEVPVVGLIVESWCSWKIRIADRTMTFQTRLSDRAAIQHFRIARSVRSMASCAALGLERGVFISERPLLIAVALDAVGVGAYSKFDLLCLKTSVGVVTIAAFHRAFEHLMMERLAELRFRFRMAAHTKLRFARFQPQCRCLIWILAGHVVNKGDRAGFFVTKWCGMRAVAVGTPDIISPMLAPAIVIMRFLSGVASQA